MDEFAIVIDLLREFGLWLVFAWLFVNERKSHDATRMSYFEDLRDLAGVKQSLNRNNQNLPSDEK